MADRGPIFAELHLAMIRAALPAAIAGAITWACDEGVAYEPDIAEALAAFVENYLGAVSLRLEADWDAAIGPDTERAAQILSGPLPASTERSAHAAIH